MASSSGCRLLQDFSVNRLLGAGSFGAVIQCQNKLDKTQYAIKVTAASDLDALREIEIMVKASSHNNLVRYYTCWKDYLNQTALASIKQTIGNSSDTGKKLLMPPGKSTLDVICMQMELCGEDLRSYLGKNRVVDATKAMNIIIQLVKGVEHLHKFGIIHRDLKPENIFTSFNDSNVVKIGDLGIATAHGGTRVGNRNLTQGVGTILYFPPEQGSNSYGKSVDIYALGIIFLELLHPSVQPAHNRNNYDPLVAMITGLRFKQVLPPVVSSKWPVASSIILKMTSVYPEERPKCAEILGAFDDKSGGGNSNDNSLVLRMGTMNLQTNGNVQHFGVGCDGCGSSTISGVRYKCTVCTDYNLCARCEQRVGLHPESHSMIKMRTSVGSPAPSPTASYVKPVPPKQNIFSPPKQNTIAPPKQNTTAPYSGAGCFLCHGTLIAAATTTDYKGRKFHNDCFICCTCGKKLLGGGSYYDKFDKNYCVDHYHEKFSPRCTGCSKIIIGLYTTVKSWPWHKECFVCSHCRVMLGTHYEKDGRYYCVNDYEELFSPKCIKCKKPCTKSWMTLDKKDAVHDACYTCCICDKTTGLYVHNGKLFCLEDYNKIRN